MADDSQQTTTPEEAEIELLFERCRQVKKRLAFLEEQERSLRQRVMKAVDLEKISKVSKFINTQT